MSYLIKQHLAHLRMTTQCYVHQIIENKLRGKNTIGVCSLVRLFHFHLGEFLFRQLPLVVTVRSNQSCWVYIHAAEDQANIQANYLPVG